MKVYVVSKDWGYEGFSEPEAVFSSQEKAEEYVKDHKEIYEIYIFVITALDIDSHSG